MLILYFSRELKNSCCLEEATFLIIYLKELMPVDHVTQSMLGNNALIPPATFGPAAIKLDLYPITLDSQWPEYIFGYR